MTALGGCVEDEPGRLGQATTSTGFVIFAHERVQLGNHAEVSGQLGVRDALGATALAVEHHGAITGDLLADSIVIDHHSAILGQVRSNALTLNHHITLSLPPASPLALPLPDLTPSIPAVVPGSQSVTVSSGATQVLPAGAYAAVLVEQSGTLRLSGGTYQLAGLTLRHHARLECVTVCDLRSAGRIAAEHHAILGSQSPSALAADLQIATLAADQGSTPALALDHHATVVGRLIAPRGTLSVGHESELRGMLIARAVLVAHQVKLAVESPLSPSDGGISADAALLDAPRPDSPRPDAAVPDAPLADRPAPDAALPDAGLPDAPLPDAALPDTVACTSIGSAGGSVQSPDGRAVLEVPAGALSNLVCFSIRIAAGQPSGSLDTAYTVEPAATSFTTPATVRLSYDPARLGASSEATLALAKVAGSAWQILSGSTVDAANDRVSAPVAETGSFGIVPSVCGDSVVSGTEACDGSVPPGTTCLSLGFLGGTLGCTSCAIDTSGCISCLPTTCAAQGKNCGTISDGCGGFLDCGTCALPQTCGGGGVPNLCGCTPSTCAALGATCGSIGDGCGGTLECGICTLPETCVANHCVCTPTTCAAELASCGSIPDGCGGSLDCGTCTPPQTCGGGGVPNTCGCTPATCAALGATCGSVPDGCGGSLECGSCTLPQTCGGGGTANQCGCTPTTCAAQGKDCGTISDGCGGTLDCGSCGAGLLCGWGGALNVCGAAYPPDPTTVAPPIQEGVATTIVEGYGFLYQGSSPIQVNVSPTAIEIVRASVVRGRVLDAAGSPRAGVVVDILSHPELGNTVTRGDGRFDLVVNGGAPIVVRFTASGLLSAQRQVSVAWQDQVTIDDVVMIAPDPQVTTIQSGGPAMQVARGSISSDSSGTRQATLLFPAGTAATMTLPDGSTAPLPTLSVRATEFTVGTLGPQRMPAGLPPNVAYTYAVELNADEAVAAGAERVTFSSPVVFYTENFLGFPVGEAVPLGWYDPKRAVWVPATSGRIVKVLSVTGGLADLDLDGSGLPADGAALSALGVTDEERGQLATLYSAGQSLWRMPIPHLTAWDANWPWNGPTPSGPDAPPSGPPAPPPTTCTWPIECQTQTLQERAPVTGTPFTLHYRSDRVPGRADGVLEIPLTSATPPASLQAVELEIHLAGRVFKQSFGPAPLQTASFTWDGLDGYGRTVRGKQPARVRLGYVLPGQYASASSFGTAGGVPIGALRESRMYWFYSNVLVGHLDAPRSDLGGWTLSGVHAYDPTSGDLYLGDGRQQGSRSTTGLSTTVAHLRNGSSTDVAVDRQGNLYMSYSGASWYDQYPHVVLKQRTDGSVVRVAGTESMGFSGDGGPATSAKLNRPMAIALDRNDNLYIVDYGNLRVRRVDAATGIITTIAGGGTLLGDGGPATDAAIDPYSIALDAHGSLYISSPYSPIYSQRTIRKVDPEGIITTVAGVSGRSIDVDRQGNVYIGHGSLLRVNADGTISTLVSYPNYSCWDGDGLPLSETCMFVQSVAVDPAGNVYLITTKTSAGGSRKLRKVGVDGIVTTIAGGGVVPSLEPNGAPATRLDFACGIGNISIAPSGAIFLSSAEVIYCTSTWQQRVYRIAPPMPGFSGTDLGVLSPDGSELYRFSASGRHFETKSTLTGATLATIGYTPDGKLASVTDGDGNVTTVQRDASGAPAAIAGPHGQSTSLALGENGWLSRITNPAGESKQLGYTPGGLMTSTLTPRGHSYFFEYGPYGRIVRHTGPDTAQKALSLARASGDDYTVSVTTGEGKTTAYGVEGLATGSVHQRNTFPTTLATDATYNTDGTSSLTFPDGSTSSSTLSPDPRWQMLAPFTGASTLRMPSTLALAQTATRTVTLADPNNPLSLSQQTDTLVQNGKTTTRVYTGSTRLETITSPLGRVMRRWIDTQGRTTRVEAPGLAPVDYTWDTQGRLSSLIQGTAPDARVTSMTYNPQGYLATSTDPLSRTASYQYDLAGRITSQSLPGGRTVLMGYDANGNLVSVTPPGRTAHLFGFTPVDETASYTPPDLGLGSPTTSYQYNLDRQLTKVTRPDGQTIVMGYDSAGRLGTITTPTGVTTYTYSPTTGTLTSIAAPGGVGLSYTWDGSLPTGTTWSGPIAGSVTRTYNNDFDVASITVAGTAFSFTRDNDRLLTGAGAVTIARDATTGFVTGTTLGSVTTGRTYSPFGELATTSASAGSTPLFATSYTRDALGRITELDETVQGVTTTWGYEYNAAGQLWRVRQDGVPVAEYQYDLNGNRLKAIDELGVETTGSYDAQDRLTSYGTATYSYTLNGELQSKTVPGVGPTTLSYDVLGNLRSATLADGTAIEYVIDGENRRIGKKVGGTLVQGFLWDGELRVVAELDGAGAVVGRFVYAEGVNVPEYMIKGGVTYRIITDHLGSPRLVVDVATGAVAQRMDFDEWGRVTSDSNAGFQPFGFAGGLYDQHTKLVRFGARDYDPEVGRWTSKDPIGFDGKRTNLYEYSLGDPINLRDSAGFQEEALPWGKKKPKPPKPTGCAMCDLDYGDCVDECSERRTTDFSVCSDKGPPDPAPPTERQKCRKTCKAIYKDCAKRNNCNPTPPGIGPSGPYRP